MDAQLHLSRLGQVLVQIYMASDSFIYVNNLYFLHNMILQCFFYIHFENIYTIFPDGFYYLLWNEPHQI